MRASERFNRRKSHVGQDAGKGETVDGGAFAVSGERDGARGGGGAADLCGAGPLPA